MELAYYHVDFMTLAAIIYISWKYTTVYCMSYGTSYCKVVDFKSQYDKIKEI